MNVQNRTSAAEHVPTYFVAIDETGWYAIPPSRVEIYLRNGAIVRQSLGLKKWKVISALRAGL